MLDDSEHMLFHAPPPVTVKNQMPGALDTKVPGCLVQSLHDPIAVCWWRYNPETAISHYAMQHFTLQFV
jgi:hypothetical protein